MPKIIVVGAGIIGPTIALLLHQRGYEPIILEKVQNLQEAGLAVAIHPNGLKVLNQAGVTDELLEGSVPWQVWRELSSEGERLGGSDLLENFPRRYGWPCAGFSRTKIQLTLKKVALDRGIAFHEGWKLVNIRETGDGVTAICEDGREVHGNALIGCDGIKSVTRVNILARKGLESTAPEYSGVTVVGGISKTPIPLQATSGAHIWYGATTSVISHPVEDGLSVWGINFAQEEATPESWQRIPEDNLANYKQEYLREFADWPSEVTEMISASQIMMKIGLYDRPEMQPIHWYEGRCILIGDAAHPATPHIGQGANQGLEDCWHLAQLLPDFRIPGNQHKDLLSTEQLKDSFSKLATLRQPRTAELVEKARTQGKLRIAGIDRASLDSRNDQVKRMWSNQALIETIYNTMYNEPFVDHDRIEKVNARAVD